MPRFLRQIWKLTEAIGFRTRKQKATVIAAGLLGVILAVPTGIALSLPVVMRFFPGTDVSRMSIYRPVLTLLSDEDSPVADPCRSVIARAYYNWCECFGQKTLVTLLVVIQDGSLFGDVPMLADVPDVAIGFRNLDSGTWEEISGPRNRPPHEN